MHQPEYTPDDLDGLAFYALGLLEGDEHLQWRQHLRAGCRQCESLVREFQETAAYFLENAAPSVAPPVTLRTKVLRVTNTSGLSSPIDCSTAQPTLSRTR